MKNKKLEELIPDKELRSQVIEQLYSGTPYWEKEGFSARCFKR